MPRPSNRSLLVGASVLTLALALVWSTWPVPDDAPRNLPPPAPPVQAAVHVPPGVDATCARPAAALTPAGQSAPAAEPLPAEPEWAGLEEPPTESPRQEQELRPLHVPYARFAEQLASFFPFMHDAPPSRAHALEYHQYAQDMMAQLHLGGDRTNLELARLMLFDRLSASRPKLSTQEQMMRGFLTSVFEQQAPAADILGFVNEPGHGPETPQRERSWDIGDKRLTVTVPEAYGMVVLLVTARG